MHHLLYPVKIIWCICCLSLPQCTTNGFGVQPLSSALLEVLLQYIELKKSCSYSLNSFRKACLFTVALANSMFPCCSGEKCGFWGCMPHFIRQNLWSFDSNLVFLYITLLKYMRNAYPTDMVFVFIALSQS